jgi:hypothetical protein
LAYSLFIMVVLEMMFEESEEHPGATPLAFSPPIFVGYVSISWFLYLRLIPRDFDIPGLV